MSTSTSTSTSSTFLTVQRRESFAFSRTAPRSTEPEVFTFERIPAQVTAVRSFVPIRPKKRCTRVMYPAKVRMHLPPPERSQAKRWLVVLCLVVLWQIYTEDPGSDTPLSSADHPGNEYQGFPFQSAEEQARQLADLGAPVGGCEGLPAPDSSCSNPDHDTDTGRSFEQSAGKSYMVALLVYHRLGSEN
ncbi:radiation-inducible immediate-early gene IEX-1 [Aulostomus maculatus]